MPYKNPEDRKAQHKRWREGNRERQREVNRSYYERNKEAKLTAGASLEAALHAVPDGYVLVPLEPTKKMHKAAWDACESGMKPGREWAWFNTKVWRAMITAAPSARTAGKPDDTPAGRE